jgi:hypothetical protein
MKKVFFTWILCLLLSHISFAQCNYFRVFHYSGKVNAGIATIKKPVAPGQVIRHGESLFLETGSQVVLFDSTGNAVVLYQKGNYPFSQLQTLCSESGNSITKKYFQFIWSRMTEEKKKEGTTIYASVTRGKKVLMQIPIDSTLLLTDKVFFSWKPVAGSKKYYLTVLNPSGKSILVNTIADTTFLWVPDTGKLVRGKAYSWHVTDIPYQTADAETHSFTFATGEQKKSCTSELDELRGQLHYSPAINALVLAGFFEQKNMFREAYIEYSEALTASPGDTVIRKTVNDFMKRKIGMK